MHGPSPEVPPDESAPAGDAAPAPDDSTAPVEETCQPWPGSRMKGKWPYGLVKTMGRTRLAHRVAWERANGPIPAGMLVLHKCDNPPCVNLSHLFLGTDKENTQDMLAKGRHHVERGDEHYARRTPGIVRGERSNAAKLSDADVGACRFVRAAYGVSAIALAAATGLSKSHMRGILAGTQRRPYGAGHDRRLAA